MWQGFIRWQSAVDFCVVVVAIYFLLRWGKEARALRVSLGILSLRIIATIARQLAVPGFNVLCVYADKREHRMIASRKQEWH
jgi:hypothetical protein